MMQNVVKVEVANEVFRIGRTKNDEGMLVKKFFVVAELGSGELYVHLPGFQGWEIQVRPEADDVILFDTGELAQERAERVCQYVKDDLATGKPLNMDVWQFLRMVHDRKP
ncbi:MULTISPECIES: hypothetical protein [unclassified Burkholderia]|uniref:hypothetical protein n=1 Tax=unclassified Burkholderia TaxID=2613784 RepID=UPI000B7AE04D|nr:MULTISPECIES: hypothetical protein [unclassified Burkholderia]MDN7491300.1 hypothetical protein [Burkholderia sp. AU45274]OXJ07059.1 hypothetical protein CFB45_33130 [Burkholderia sp. HI2500]